MRLRLLLALGALAALLTLPPSASAAPPAPFGHACAPTGRRPALPTASDAARVPSFDGVALDVFLPPAGDDPFPTVAMRRGFAGSKADVRGRRRDLDRERRLLRPSRGTAIATLRSPEFTLLGRTTVNARVRVRGSNASSTGRSSAQGSERSSRH